MSLLTAMAARGAERLVSVPAGLGGSRGCGDRRGRVRRCRDRRGRARRRPSRRRARGREVPSLAPKSGRTRRSRTRAGRRGGSPGRHRQRDSFSSRYARRGTAREPVLLSFAHSRARRSQQESDEVLRLLHGYGGPADGWVVHGDSSAIPLPRGRTTRRSALAHRARSRDRRNRLDRRACWGGVTRLLRTQSSTGARNRIAIPRIRARIRRGCRGGFWPEPDGPEGRGVGPCPEPEEIGRGMASVSDDGCSLRTALRRTIWPEGGSRSRFLRT